MHDKVIMRIIADLPDEQLAALGEFCQRKGISRAEAVRRAVAALLAQEGPVEREMAFGGWAARGDSRMLVEDRRGEWEGAGNEGGHR
jgi:hypothetical protein